jgi:hypothetical protein
MTETKQDIQAQMDRLERDWLLGKNRYMFNGSFPRKPSEIPLYSLRVALGLGAPVICLGLCAYLFVFWEWSAAKLVFGSLFLSNAIILIVVNKEVRRHSVAANLYAAALDEFESKRAELQAKLDAPN